MNSLDELCAIAELEEHGDRERGGEKPKKGETKSPLSSIIGNETHQSTCISASEMHACQFLTRYLSPTGVSWSEQEHKLFLEGLNVLGKVRSRVHSVPYRRPKIDAFSRPSDRRGIGVASAGSSSLPGESRSNIVSVSHTH